MTDFKVGQKVTVTNNYEIEGITTVVRIGKLKMVLADGSEWKASGWTRWGLGSRDWSSTHVRAFRDADAEIFERLTLLKALKAKQWNDLTTDEMRRVHQIIMGKPHD